MLGIERDSTMIEFGSKKAQEGGHEQPAMLESILNQVSYLLALIFRDKSQSQYDLLNFASFPQTMETSQQSSMQH